VLKRIHHIAIICSNYQKSKSFYIDTLGFTALREVYREDRKSYKLDLALNGVYLIELFSFENAPARPSYPEATGLRHLAFEVEDLDEVVQILKNKMVIAEPIRTDEFTNKRFAFIADPDNLPIELYEK
jgi:glyoxylase I family protein